MEEKMEEILFAISVVLVMQILILLWFRSLFEEHSKEMKTFLKNLNSPKNIVIERATLHVGEVKNV